MYRTKVAPDGGMLFVWPTPIVSQMWMKHTLVPLDMVFIKADGTIDSIAENTVPQSLRVISSHGKVTATLELAGGTTATARDHGGRQGRGADVSPGRVMC